MTNSHITIYPPGTRQTDYDGVERLALISPKSFSAVQELLMATDDVIRSTWLGRLIFGKKRYNKMVTAYAALVHGFAEDMLYVEEISTYGIKHATILYLNEVSAVFPNWQDVYMFLNKFVWEIASDL